MPGSDARSIIAGSVRANWRPAVLYFVAPAVLVPTLITAGFLGLVALRGGYSGDASPDSAAVPPRQRAAAMLELFGCLRAGPDACAEFDVTSAFLDSVSNGSFVYTRWADTDPGEPAGVGQLRVRLAGLAAAQLQAVGAAVTRGAGVPDEPAMTVKTADSGLETVTFPAGAGLEGTVAFEVQSGAYRLLSITYRAPSGGGP